MGVQGDFASLRQMSRRMQTLSRTGVQRVTKQIASEVDGLVHGCFQQSTDVNGRAFAPLKRRRGRPLVDTGRLLSSLRLLMAAGGDSFAISATVPYAAIQNFGSSRIPARQFLPAPGELPAGWEVRLERAAYLVMAELAP